MNSADFTVEEKLLLDLLKVTFSGKKASQIAADAEDIIIKYENIDWDKLTLMADRHGVIALLYDALGGGAVITKSASDRLKSVSNKIVLQNYHLIFLARTIIQLMKQNDIPVVLLKGSGTGGLYPAPELRKSGDIDLLILNPADIDKCERVLEKAGFDRTEEQVAHHHIVYCTKEKIEIELHIMLAEPFDNRKTNQYLQNLYYTCSEHVTEKEVMGITLPIFDDAYHAFYLLLHMLQHFLRSGFGLKLFCDWVVFWKQNVPQEHCDKFMELVSNSGLKIFAQTVTAACVGYIGLEPENVQFMFGKIISVSEARKISESMICEVIEAEEFGKSSADRMVMMRGSGILGYMREFHHQMCLNFPKAGKIFVLWPFLWIYTLVKFVRNNRKLRKISSASVLKKAKQRSRLMKQLKLFEHK